MSDHQMQTINTLENFFQKMYIFSSKLCMLCSYIDLQYMVCHLFKSRNISCRWQNAQHKYVKPFLSRNVFFSKLLHRVQNIISILTMLKEML